MATHQRADRTDVRDSNPNAASAEGLGAGAGDGLGNGMGVSSERVPSDPNSIEGTGSRGTATHTADGVWETLADNGGAPAEPDPDADPASDPEHRPHPEDPAEGPDSEAETDWQGIDRTVGEPKPGGVDPHPFDPAKNPRHSHG